MSGGPSHAVGAHPQPARAASPWMMPPPILPAPSADIRRQQIDREAFHRSGGERQARPCSPRGLGCLGCRDGRTRGKSIRVPFSKLLTKTRQDFRRNSQQ